MLMKYIRKYVEKNLFVNDLLRRTLFFKYNSKISQYVSEISEVDSIENFNDFRKIVNQCPPNILNSAYTLKRAYAENTSYGYATSLMRYANLQNENILYLPLLEHGIVLHSLGIDFGRYNPNMSYIFQGRSSEALWKNRKFFRPIYYIGPYVHYAEDYYEQHRVKQIKSRNRSTLLIFPPHSSEFESSEFVYESFSHFLFDTIAKKYNTIYACVFWRDANSKYTKFLDAQGVKIVSAGFKIDPKFVCRLRTIISLSDCVIYPAFTTSIGYAYYLNKRIICVDNEKNINWRCDWSKERQNRMTHNFSNVMNYLSTIFNYYSDDDEKIKNERENFIEKFWGIKEIKTPEEIRSIYFENKKYIIKNLGF